MKFSNAETTSPEGENLRSEPAPFDSASTENVPGTPQWNEKTFHRIEEVKELKSFLAVSLGKGLKQRDSLTLDDVSHFYKEFPSRAAYEVKFKMNNFLDGYTAANGAEKGQVYRTWAPIFVDLMFPLQG